jgi:hypothetical protein
VPKRNIATIDRCDATTATNETVAQASADLAPRVLDEIRDRRALRTEMVEDHHHVAMNRRPVLERAVTAERRATDPVHREVATMVATLARRAVLVPTTESHATVARACRLVVVARALGPRTVTSGHGARRARERTVDRVS